MFQPLISDFGLSRSAVGKAPVGASASSERACFRVEQICDDVVGNERWLFAWQRRELPMLKDERL